jgi:hypothetical protein
VFRPLGDTVCPRLRRLVVPRGLFLCGQRHVMALLHVLGKERAIGGPVVTKLALEALDALDRLGMVV